jgi:L-ascorbate metabolism protein UlaG (beta-lactamase superfamily)
MVLLAREPAWRVRRPRFLAKKKSFDSGYRRGDSVSTDLLYLRPNVQVEPLVDQWYAWSHLIPPATAARNLTDRHLKIMDSYISAPQVHANAAKNPKMAGGPFIDYDGKRVTEVRDLREQTKRLRSALLELSSAIGELENLLRTTPKGHSLQPLYDRVPDPLKGYVELVYDLNNHANFRIVEPLLYNSRYYDRDAQSLMLSLVSGDDRPFVLSTPRLESDDLLHWRIPFDSGAVDQLFLLKKNPQCWCAIQKMLEMPANKESVLRSLFTEEEPPAYEPYKGKGMRWRYFGHACILAETADFSMLIDPVLSYTYETNLSRYTYLDLPESIDCVLITHNHQDHILLETLLQLRHKTKRIIVPRNSGGTLQDPSVKLLLQNIGFRNVTELSEMESVEFNNVSITGLPFFGEHADVDIRSKLAYLLKFNRHSVLFAADSCNIEPELYHHIHRQTGDVEALFLGMECDGAPLSWLYGPLLTQRMDRTMDESRRLAGCNFVQAEQMVNRFRCKDVYVYAMGQEPWLNYVMSLKYTPESRPIVESNKLIEHCRAAGIRAERLFGEKEILLD